MPKFTDIPSLELVYTVQASEYSYAGLEISSLFSAENQISLVFEFDDIKKNGVVVAGTALSSSERTQLQRIPSVLYTIDHVHETVSHTIPGSSRVVDGSTFEYTAGSDASPDTPLRVQRAVDISEASVVFQPGSRLTSDQLNAAVQQCFLSVQELYGLSSLAEGSAVGGGGGASTLGDLVDVSLYGPLNRQALVFNEFSQLWENTPLTKQDLYDFNESDYATPSDLAILTTAIGLNAGSITTLQNDMPTVLDDLTDVDTTTITPQDGQTLVYNDLDSKWYPGDGSVSGVASTVKLPFVQATSQSAVSGSASYEMITTVFSPTYTGDASMQAAIDDTSGNRKWVCPADGRYELDCIVNWSPETTDGIGTAKSVALFYKVNGTIVHGYSGLQSFNVDRSGGADRYIADAGRRTVDLVAGDEVTITFSSSVGTVRHTSSMWSIHRTDFDATVVGSISLSTLQAETAAATSFVDFQARIAAL